MSLVSSVGLDLYQRKWARNRFDGGSSRQNRFYFARLFRGKKNVRLNACTSWPEKKTGLSEYLSYRPEDTDRQKGVNGSSI